MDGSRPELMRPPVDRERDAPIVEKIRGTLRSISDEAALKFLAQAIADEVWASVVEKGHPASTSSGQRDAERLVRRTPPAAAQILAAFEGEGGPTPHGSGSSSLERSKSATRKSL
jgi:hypothetical protein